MGQRISAIGFSGIPVTQQRASLSPSPPENTAHPHHCVWSAAPCWSVTSSVLSTDSLSWGLFNMSGARQPFGLLTPPTLLSPDQDHDEDCCHGLLEESSAFLPHLPSGEALYDLHGAAMMFPSLALRSPWAAGSREAEVGEN